MTTRPRRRRRVHTRAGRGGPGPGEDSTFVPALSRCGAGRPGRPAGVCRPRPGAGPTPATHLQREWGARRPDPADTHALQTLMAAQPRRRTVPWWSCPLCPGPIPRACPPSTARSPPSSSSSRSSSRANAPGAGPRPADADAVLAVGAGAVLALVADTLLGALVGPFVDVGVVLSAEMTIAALFDSAMFILVGRCSPRSSARSVGGLPGSATVSACAGSRGRESGDGRDRSALAVDGA